ncbi:hypothetical protein [Lentzea sp. E54]|uniref:hypothetical protein n=1 Tax=Lentzea xerophila TaxID=3435883 RepID=UPI003DA35C85
MGQGFVAGADVLEDEDTGGSELDDAEEEGEVDDGGSVADEGGVLWVCVGWAGFVVSRG